MSNSQTKEQVLSDPGRPEEPGEVRTYEAIKLCDESRMRTRAIRMLIDRVNLFEMDNKRVVSRLFIKQEGDYVTCEAFYREVTG